MSTKKDVVLWGALACALAGTAYAEYTLATATGVNKWVALAVPGALDLYVIRALQVRRDVLVAVLGMVAANVASHLVREGEVPVDWRLHSAVAALAPLILWRVYTLAHPRTRDEDEVPDEYPSGTSEVPLVKMTRPEVRWEVGADPYTVNVDVPAHMWPVMEMCDGCYHAPHLQRTDPACEVDGCGCGQPLYPPVPDEVPPTWTTEYGTDVVSTPEPKTYPEYLQPNDHGYLDALGLYLADCEECKRNPTIKDCKSFCGVGQDRARRLLRYAGYPAPEEES